VSEVPPDQPQGQDPLAEPHWQQPDQPQQREPDPLPQWPAGGPQQQEPLPPESLPPVAEQASPWGYPGPVESAPGTGHDRRNLGLLAVGGGLLLVVLGVGAVLIVNGRHPEQAASGPAPIATSAERAAVTTSAAPAPETAAATTSPAGGAEVIKIGTTEFAEYADGLRVRVTSVRRTTFSDLSGTPGAGVITTIKITNGSRARVDLALVDVGLRYGADGIEAEFVFDDNVHEFSGGLAPGRTATATYGFSVPRNQPDITVEVAPGFDYDSSTFEGRVG
jgi:hypothetical protein